MLYRIMAITISVFLASTNVCLGGFNVTIGNASLTPGGTATVDVTITGSELLDFYITEIRLTAIGGATPGGVQFVNPQPTDSSTLPSYVFYGNSGFYIQNVTTTSKPNDTLTIGDFTSDNLGVNVANGKLLSRINISAQSVFTGIQQYQINLNASATQFQDPNFNDIPLSSSRGGLITVSGNATIATPVPASALLLGLGMAALGGFSARRSRVGTKAQAQP